MLGMSPVDLVERIFPKYGILKFRIIEYRDNSFAEVFPIKVMQEHFQLKSVEDLQRRLIENRLTSSESHIYESLRKSAIDIRTHVFQNGETGQLFLLSEFLKRVVGESENLIEGRERFRNIFYGEILATLASAKVDFEFNQLPLHPEPIDFLYMSTTLATSNMPSEIVPMTNDVRMLMWIQMMLSYFMLAFMVAALVRLLKIG